MDKKGQAGFGFIVMAAIAILVGLALYTGTFAQNVGTMTQTTSVNRSIITLPAA